MRFYFGIFLVVFCFLAAGLFIACDNVLGLGPMVNTEKPTIGIPDEEDGGIPAGTYLQGKDNPLVFDVEQKFGLKTVFVEVDYTDKLTGLQITGERHEAIEDPPGSGLWKINLDVSNMTDGTIKTRVIATDVSGNTTTSTDIVYTVKNTPPKIELTVPLVSGSKFDTEDFVSNVEKINQTNPIMGYASDLFGIKNGYPQIMIWPKDYAGTRDGDYDPVSKKREWGVWRTMVNDKNEILTTDIVNGKKDIQFRWPMVKLVNNAGNWELPDMDGLVYPASYLDCGIYYYKIRVMDMFGNTNVYPNRTDNTLGSTPQDPLPPASHPKKFMSVEVISTTSPVFTWKQFERYYNHKSDFTAEVTVMSPNGMNGNTASKVSAMIGTISASFDDPGNISKIVDIQVSANGEQVTYPIVILKEKIYGHNPGEGSSDEHFLLIKAVDNHGKFSITNRNIIIDIDKPAMSFIEPFELEKDTDFKVNGPDDFELTTSAPELTSTVWFRGITDDNQKVVKMYYALGKYEVTRADRTDNTFRTTNGTTVTDTNSAHGWIDTGLSTVSGPIQNHPNGSINAKWGGSLSSWNWRFEDIADLIRLTSDPAGQSGNKFVKPYGANGYANNLWELPISFKLIDIAENVEYINAVIIIDPDKDRPTVDVRSNTAFSQIPPAVPSVFTMVGGEVRLNGTANDNEFVYDVMVRVTAQSDANCFTDITQREGSPAPSEVKTADKSSQYFNPAYTGNSVYVNTYKNFVPVEIIGSKGPILNWQYYINSDKSLTKTGQLRRVWVEFMALDSSIYTQNKPKYIRLNQPITRVELVFSDKVPLIEDIKILQPGSKPSSVVYSYGKTVSGFVTITAKITAKADIDTIEVRSDGESFGNINYAAINSPDVYNKPYTVRNNARDYDLYIPLNTNDTGDASLLNGKFKNKAASHNIYIQVKDTTSPQAYTTQETLNLKIDNYYPSASYTGNTNVKGEYTISGYAWDTGTGDITVYGIEKIAVYLTNASGNPVNLDGTAVTAGWTTQKAKLGRKTIEPFPYSANPVVSAVIAEGAEQTLPFFPDMPAPVPPITSYEPTAAGIVVNGIGNLGGGKYYQYFNSDPLKVEWYVRINDSSVIPDGHYNVNYVVFDTAGNASHYSEPIYIANNHPVIDEIWLGTDIKGANSVSDPDDYFDYYNTDNFRIRNSKFSLKLKTQNGNPGTAPNGFSYRVSYVDREEVNIGAGGIGITKGDIYTITDPDSIAPNEWVDLGVLKKPADNDYRGVTFAAMNTYTGSGKARVYRYKNPSGGAAAVSLPFPSNNVKIQGFLSSASYGPALIKDSEKTASALTHTDGKFYPKGSILPENRKQRFFTIKVWDSTMQGAPEAEQLADAVVIAVDVDNTDTQIPSIYIDPFFWTRAANNSLYGNSKNNGHIELESDLPAPFGSVSDGINDIDPKVSGKVSFRGTASDNNVIEGIYFRIPTQTSNGGTPINFGGSTGTYFTAGLYTGGSWDKRTGNGWEFTIEGDEHPTMDGHTVKWRLDFDSSFINGVVHADNVLTVVAKDNRDTLLNNSEPRDWTRSLQTRPTAKTEVYRFDVVPYIGEVITPLTAAFRTNPSAFNRSAKGWYPVKENDNIEIKGFNLGRTAGEGGALVTTVMINGAAVPAANVVTNSKNSISVRIDSDAAVNTTNNVVSGPLVVSLGSPSIDSLNNINAGAVEYNKEPNNLNNNTLTDDRNMYVWRVDAFHNYGTPTTEFPYINPVMRMDSGSNWYMAYGGASTSTGELWTAKNSNTGNAAFTATNRVRHVSIAYDKAGNYYTIGSNQTAGSTEFKFAARFAGGTGTWREITANLPAAGGDRFQLPKIATYGGIATPTTTNPTKIFLSYFDSLSSTNQLRIHLGAATANSVAGVVLNAPVEIAKNNDTYEGSMFSAVGFLSTGRPVIAWYDRTNMNLVLSYGNNASASATSDNTTGAQWQANAKIVHTLAGSHVDMAIDAEDNIHLAYYDALNGGLYYALVPVTGGIPAVNTDTHHVKVDTYMSAGTRIMLNIRQETHTAAHPSGAGIRYVPYISYFHASFDETKNSIRVAWRNDFGLDDGKIKPGSDENDRLTGTWEVMTVPTVNVPASGQIISSGVPASGSISGTAAAFQTNLTKTMIVGYLTNQNYEGAVLKKDLY